MSAYVSARTVTEPCGNTPHAWRDGGLNEAKPGGVSLAVLAAGDKKAVPLAVPIGKVARDSVTEGFDSKRRLFLTLLSLIRNAH